MVWLLTGLRIVVVPDGARLPAVGDPALAVGDWARFEGETMVGPKVARLPLVGEARFAELGDMARLLVGLN